MFDLKGSLLTQKAALLNYLKSKLDAGDWHAVQDAASDIRELDAKLAILAEVQPSGPIPYPREDYIPRDQGRHATAEDWDALQRKQNAEQHAGQK